MCAVPVPEVIKKPKKAKAKKAKPEKAKKEKSTRAPSAYNVFMKSEIAKVKEVRRAHWTCPLLVHLHVHAHWDPRSHAPDLPPHNHRSCAAWKPASSASRERTHAMSHGVAFSSKTRMLRLVNFGSTVFGRHPSADHQKTHKPERPDICDGCRVARANRKYHYRGQSDRCPQN